VFSERWAKSEPGDSESVLYLSPETEIRIERTFLSEQLEGRSCVRLTSLQGMGASRAKWIIREGELGVGD
jgi:hypothetical protein